MQKFPFFYERFIIFQFTGRALPKLHHRVAEAASPAKLYGVPEGNVFLRPLVAVLVLGSIASLAWPAGFDKPVSKKVVDLGPSKVSLSTRAKVSCYWFPGFMVKEIDLGEKGASRLAIVPSTKKNPAACTRLREKGEREVNPDDWSGYFKGVKGSLVFFDADDGWNGGLGFAVYDSKTGKKTFDDVALGDLDFIEVKGAEPTVRYIRVVDGGCNVPKEDAACWDKIKQRLNVRSAPMPDCKVGYERNAQALAKGRCQAQSTDTPECLAKEITLARQQTADASSIVTYPVETVLSASPATKPLGGDLKCWPSD